MSDTVALALIAAIPPTIAAIGAIIDSLRQRKKVNRAEFISPGITNIPKGSETRSTLVVNDPKTTDEPETKYNEAKETP